MWQRSLLIQHHLIKENFVLPPIVYIKYEVGHIVDLKAFIFHRSFYSIGGAFVILTKEKRTALICVMQTSLSHVHVNVECPFALDYLSCQTPASNFLQCSPGRPGYWAVMPTRLDILYHSSCIQHTTNSFYSVHPGCQVSHFRPNLGMYAIVNCLPLWTIHSTTLYLAAWNKACWCYWIRSNGSWYCHGGC